MDQSSAASRKKWFRFGLIHLVLLVFVAAIAFRFWIVCIGLILFGIFLGTSMLPAILYFRLFGPWGRYKLRSVPAIVLSFGALVAAAVGPILGIAVVSLLAETIDRWFPELL